MTPPVRRRGRFRVVRLSLNRTVVLDCVAWGALSFAVGYATHRRPAAAFSDDGAVTRLRPFESEGRWYERRLCIGAWKRRIPEAGGFFDGGFSKRSLPSRDAAHLERYVAETRRAEVTHWALVASAPLFVLWNPPALAAVQVGYATAANLPCIAIQRYNRARLLRLLARRRWREAGAAGTGVQPVSSIR